MTSHFSAVVVEFAKEHNIIVVHDAAYADVTFDGYRAPSFLETPGAIDVGIELYSLSKTYNMTGWRIAAALGNADVISGLGKGQDKSGFRSVSADPVCGNNRTRFKLKIVS